MSAFFKLIGLVLLFVVSVFFFVPVLFFVLAVLVFVCISFSLAWIFDMPISIKSDGKRIGTYRRSTGFVRKMF